MIDIIIPTCKPPNQIQGLVKEITATAGIDFTVIATCFNVSAATNRNYGLNQARSDIVIMIDDDISGLFGGWAGKLVQPLFLYEDIVMVSARLMKSKTKFGVMMNLKVDLSREIVEAPERVLPSACIAFRKDELRFDEAYIGAGYEDTDFCMQMGEKYLDGRFMVHNGVKVIHKNEMKNQLIGGRLLHNKQYFQSKWFPNESNRTN